MMGPTEKLIKEFARQGHPLGRSITVEEVPVLIEALRRRLGVSGKELDLSPASLKRLERQLIDLHQSTQKRGGAFSDEELVRLVREVAAYIGEVLVTHAEGQWGEESQTLWGTEVIFEGPWVVVKGRRFISPYPTHFIMGGEAAWAWDEIVEGRKPNLYRMYREARAKRIKERL